MALIRTLAVLATLAALSPWSHAAKLNDTGVLDCVSPDTYAPYWECTGTAQDPLFGRDLSAANNANGYAGFAYAKVCNSGQDAGTGTCPESPVLGTGPDQWRCTRDKVSGLTWELKTHDDSVSGRRHKFNLEGQAQRYAELASAQALCGSTAWRIPTRMELLGIVNFGFIDESQKRPAVVRQWLPNVPPGETWTSDRHGESNTSNWVVDFGSGLSTGRDREFPRFVRLVSGKAALPQFLPFESEVTDGATGLVWARCNVGYQWKEDDCKRVSDKVRVSWLEALEIAKSTPGWRLPNVRELMSIVKPDGYKPAIAKRTFPKTLPEDYWTNSSGFELGRPGVGCVWVVSFLLGDSLCRSSIADVAAVRLVKEDGGTSASADVSRQPDNLLPE